MPIQIPNGISSAIDSKTRYLPKDSQCAWSGWPYKNGVTEAQLRKNKTVAQMARLFQDAKLPWHLV